MAVNLAQQIIEAARRLPRKVYLPNPDADKLAEDPFPALQTWLTEIERNNSGKQFLFCLDEYEGLGEVVEAPHPARQRCYRQTNAKRYFDSRRQCFSSAFSTKIYRTVARRRISVIPNS
ncbi:hypothetical protein CDG76_28055 [Nostoc sp. 'Peltigera membranacea cyanobiont' 210A]|uniref:hypothetical protein n=1 Tax=Nostoc sp. 'Peltigera membranacea cyanobiont' 210A TaxID=2014529 RepID=UPI000B95BC4C|nr:hypothetical protein [Nostoc sp. 'Peltigera membranacea cyanobiont' 210A]OYD91111.1 hypothetical protein CDG76_28055 [Nostoc sp. 'Peltigera membranacea cyanobiont' 210A]